MSSFADLLQQGANHAWLFAPSAILLGALHGLEPGHSKTMMAAFIVAIHGTVGQAVLLGLAATVSHTMVVWAVALGGLSLGQNFDSEANEPYFQIASAAIILGVAIWMVWRIWRDQHEAAHQHDHAHHHIQEDSHHHDMAAPGHQDSHARAHAKDVERRFAGRKATTGQIIVFGLTGGLIPCPAAITVLLLCLQLKEVTLGALLVLCFSIGLAITLVAAGSVAALGAGQVAGRWPWFGAFARRAPYLSSLLIVTVGIYVGAQGFMALAK